MYEEYRRHGRFKRNRTYGSIRMESDDVLGLTLEDALKKFKKLGINPTVTETFDLRTQDAEEGTFRVVKQTQEGENRTIIICKIPDPFR